MQHFKFVNWEIRFLMSRTGYLSIKGYYDYPKKSSYDKLFETDLASKNLHLAKIHWNTYRDATFKNLFFKAADPPDNDVMKQYNLVVYLNFIGLDGWKIR